MRRLAIALAALLLGAPTALAQSLATQAECLREALATYLQYPVRFAGRLEDQGNGFFTQHEVILVTSGPEAPPGRISSLEVQDFDCAGFRAGGLPATLRLRANGISVSRASHPLTGPLPGLGSDRLFDVTLDLSYDAAARRLVVRQADLEFPGILTLTLAGEASGVDLGGLRLTSAGLTGLGLVAALTGSLHGLDLWLWNESGERLLEAFARGQGRTLEQQRQLWLGEIAAQRAAPGNAGADPLLRALEDFLRDPRQLRLTARPPGGQVTLAPLVAAPNLAEQIRLLGLTAQSGR